MKMKGEIRFALLSAALAAFTLPGLAQSTSAQAAAITTTPSSTAAPSNDQVNAQTINQRKDNQQDRIANGEKNGTMTPGQASRVENREQNIENQQKADMAAHNGHLTKGEQKQLNREQNRTSKQIYKDKHDGK